MEESGPAGIVRVPAYGLDSIDVCLFTEEGRQKCVVVVYPTGDITRDYQAMLRPLFSWEKKPSGGWYEFSCELIVERATESARLGSLFPPVFYVFDEMPADIKGVRIFSNTVTSQIPRVDFHSEIGT